MKREHSSNEENEIISTKRVKLDSDNERNVSQQQILSVLLKQNLVIAAANFKTNPTILNLSCIITSFENLKEILSALQFNNTLTQLDLSRNYTRIGDEGAKHIAEALKYNITLTRLNLSYNNINDKSVLHIVESLKDNTTLTYLDLSGNNINVEGAKHIAEVLLHNTFLTYLILSQNNIHNEGSKHIAESLKHNTSVIYLNLSGNNINNEGAKHIAEVLLHNTFLTYLNLSCNDMEEESTKHIIEALEHNTTFTHLILSANNIGAKGIKHLAEFLKHNTTLIYLELVTSTEDIGHSDYEEEKEGIEALAHALPYNYTILKVNKNMTNDRIEAVLNRNNKLLNDTITFMIERFCNKIDTKTDNALGIEINEKTQSDKIDIRYFNNPLKDIYNKKILNEEKKGYYKKFKSLQVISKSQLKKIFISKVAKTLDNKDKVFEALIFKAENCINTNYLPLRGICKNSVNTNNENNLISLLTLPIEIIAKIVSFIDRNLWEPNTPQSLMFRMKEKCPHAVWDLKQNQTFLVIKNIDEREIIYLPKILEENPLINTIRLSNSSISDKGIIDFVKILENTPLVKTINLSNSFIGDKGIIDFAKILEKNFTFTEVNLQGNLIGKEGMKTLAEFVKNNSTLIVLDLSRNFIEDEGIKALAEAIKNNQTLTTIDLSENNIGEEGIKAVEQALEENHTIISIKGIETVRISELLNRNLEELKNENSIKVDTFDDNEQSENMDSNYSINRLKSEENDVYGLGEPNSSLKIEEIHEGAATSVLVGALPIISDLEIGE